jgi:hypothetical protein
MDAAYLIIRDDLDYRAAAAKERSVSLENSLTLQVTNLSRVAKRVHLPCNKQALTGASTFGRNSFVRIT